MIPAFRSPIRHLVSALLGCTLALAAALTQAAGVLTTLGPDGLGIGRVVTQLDASGNPTASFALGDGSVAYNGLSWRSTDSRFYAIANDMFGQSSLVSFDASGAPSLATVGALGTGFMGMAYRQAEDAFYASSTAFNGESTLMRITSTGSTNIVGSLGLGFMGGLAFGAAPGMLYAVSADDFGVQRRLQQVDVATGIATALFDLGDGSIAFNGGLVWNDTAALFEVIGSDGFGNSSLFSFDLANAASLATTGAIGPGYFNAGLSLVAPIAPPPPPPPPPVPEPGTLALLLAGLLGAHIALPSSRPRRKT